MDMLKPLFWQQGLFLQPQHFQLMDQSFRGLLAPLEQHIVPHFWGVLQLQVNTARLGAGILEVQKGDFIFQDGTHVVFPGNAVMNVRVLDESREAPLKEFVELKIWNGAGENVTVVENLEKISGATTRFVTTVDSEEVGDLHAGGPTGRVHKMQYVLKLLWESEIEHSGSYLLIPLGRIETVSGETRWAPDYIPPCPVVAGSSSLSGLLGEIRDQLTLRGYQLDAFKKKRGVHSAQFGSRDMVFILALRSVNRFIPLLHHYMETPRIHPWIVYGALRQLAGELSSFSEKFNALGAPVDGEAKIPPYNHIDLWGCFSAVQNMISHLLDEITAGPEYVVRLANEGTFYAADLKPAIFEGRNRFYLSVRTDENAATITQSLNALAKLGAREDLQNIVSRALPGIDLEHQSIPPQELPRRSHTHYFLINSRSHYWDSVIKNRNIAFYWNNAPGDLELELMVVGRVT